MQAIVRLYAKNNGPHTTSFSVSLIFHLEHLVLLGKLIGGFCALSGVFILTLPIPIVVNSFAQFYKNRLWRNEVTDTFLIISILVRGTSYCNHHNIRSSTRRKSGSSR